MIPGGETHNIFGWGCAAQSWKPLPYFRPKYTISQFTLFQTWLSKCIPHISDPVRCGNFSNSQWIYGIQDFAMSQTMFTGFFFAINVHSNTRYSKNGIPDQTDGIYTLFQTEMEKSTPYFRLEDAWKWCPFGAAHSYMAYICGSTPPPPPEHMIYQVSMIVFVHDSQYIIMCHCTQPQCSPIYSIVNNHSPSAYSISYNHSQIPAYYLYTTTVVYIIIDIIINHCTQPQSIHIQHSEQPQSISTHWVSKSDNKIALVSLSELEIEEVRMIFALDFYQ